MYFNGPRNPILLIKAPTLNAPGLPQDDAGPARKASDRPLVLSAALAASLATNAKASQGFRV